MTHASAHDGSDPATAADGRLSDGPIILPMPAARGTAVRELLDKFAAGAFRLGILETIIPREAPDGFRKTRGEVVEKGPLLPGDRRVLVAGNPCSEPLALSGENLIEPAARPVERTVEVGFALAGPDLLPDPVERIVEATQLFL